MPVSLFGASRSTRRATLLVGTVALLATACTSLGRLQGENPSRTAVTAKPTPAASGVQHRQELVSDPRIVDELAPGRWRVKSPLVHAFWAHPGSGRFQLHLLFLRLPASPSCIRDARLAMQLDKVGAGPLVFEVRASLFDFQANRVGHGTLVAGPSVGRVTLQRGATATINVTQLFKKWAEREREHGAYVRDNNGFAVALRAVGFPRDGRASVWMRGRDAPTMTWDEVC